METYIMKKRIIWQDAILKKIKIVFFFFIFFTISNFSFASERWVVDKTLSIIEFELPVLFAKNVKGTFNSIDGYVEIDTNTKNLLNNYAKRNHTTKSQILRHLIRTHPFNHELRPIFE